MLSKEILEAQATVELPAREMMDFNFSWIHAEQANVALQAANDHSVNLAEQGNAIVVLQSN